MLLGQKRRRWNRWDDKLLMAHYMLSDYEVEGWPIWVDNSERVSFDAKKRTSKSGAAIERAQWLAEKAQSKKKGDTAPPFGQRFYAVPKTVDGKPMPRRKEWLEEQQRIKAGEPPGGVADPDMVAEYRARRKNRNGGGV